MASGMIYLECNLKSDLRVKLGLQSQIQKYKYTIPNTRTQVQCQKSPCDKTLTNSSRSSLLWQPTSLQLNFSGYKVEFTNNIHPGNLRPPNEIITYLTIGENNPNNQSDPYTKQTKGWQIQSLRPPNLALPTQFPMIAQISWVLRGHAGKIRG